MRDKGRGWLTWENVNFSTRSQSGERNGMAGWYISGIIQRFKGRWEGIKGMVSSRNAPLD